MSHKNLEEVLQAAGNPVKMLRNSPLGPYVYPVVPSEFSNWRDEQRAWKETCVLFNQSYHMADMWIEGPDALKLLSATGINSFENFPVNKAKQFVGCNYDGYVIGDAILFHLDKEQLLLVGRPSIHNWVQYHAETGGYKVTLAQGREVHCPGRPDCPPALSISGPGPQRASGAEQAQRRARPGNQVLQHGGNHHRGTQGPRACVMEWPARRDSRLWGPHEEREEIRAAIVEAGEEFGLRQVGARAYATNTLESGWIPSPMPAVYSGEKMKPFRQWLPATRL